MSESTLTVVGLAESVNPALETWIIPVPVQLPRVPVAVTVKLPDAAGAVEDALRVSVESESLFVTVTGLNCPVTPVGSPETPRSNEKALPTTEFSLAETATVPEDPVATRRLVGSSVRMQGRCAGHHDRVRVRRRSESRWSRSR